MRTFPRVVAQIWLDREIWRTAKNTKFEISQVSLLNTGTHVRNEDENE
jgi:hypothetical protein